MLTVPVSDGRVLVRHADRVRVCRSPLCGPAYGGTAVIQTRRTWSRRLRTRCPPRR